MVSWWSILIFLLNLGYTHYFSVMYAAAVLPDSSTTDFASVYENLNLDDMGDATVFEHKKYDTLSTLHALTRSCVADEQSIINAQSLLREDLYRKTYPLNQRSLLDMPQFYFDAYRPELREKGQPWRLMYQFFLNVMPRMYFTATSDIINSYLALGNPNFITNLDELGFDLNLMQVLGILENAGITQYRTGCMMGHQFIGEKWLVDFKIPIEYMLRHFALTAVEQDDLRRALGQEQDDETEFEFAERHLIADRVGLGDLRLYVLHKLTHKPTFTAYCGFESTFPFAWAFKKGPYGNHFKKHAPTPNLDLVNLLNVLIQDPLQAQQIGLNFLLAALDRLSRILLETGLGNNGHMGAGFLIWGDMQVRPKLSFKTRLEVEYLFGAKEQRYYIQTKDLNEFDKLLDPTEESCLSDLAFLQEQLINTLFPQGYNTVVWPGFLIKMSAALAGKVREAWNVALGYDFWFQEKEMLGKINAPVNILPKLRKKLAIHPQAFQNKLFGFVSYSTHHHRFDWACSVHGDITFLSSGIGMDYNLGVSFELLL